MLIVGDSEDYNKTDQNLYRHDSVFLQFYHELKEKKLEEIEVFRHLKVDLNLS